MENKNITMVTGSLEQLEGIPDLMKVILDSTIDKIPEGYIVERITYEKGNEEFNYGLKVVAAKKKKKNFHPSY